MKSWSGPTQSPPVCLECGEQLNTQDSYWVTAYPNGVHDGCRRWEAEPFPFGGNLERVQFVASSLRRTAKLVISNGVWLAGVRRAWPKDARQLTREWAARKATLRLELARLGERFDV